MKSAWLSLSRSLTRIKMVRYFMLKAVMYIRKNERMLSVPMIDASMVNDRSFAGILDAKEIMSSFEKLGLKIDETEARRLLKRMDASLSLTISFEEFRYVD